MLIGRDEECARIERLLSGAAQGASGALVLRGEAGIGKSALLRHAIHRAGSMAGPMTGPMTVLTARGLEVEAELPFATLGDLLHPVLASIEAIPQPQATALAGALAVGPAQPVDRFTVYAATLSVLAAVAEERPLLVVVDDGHWIDESSREALLFTAHRLHAEGIALIFAIREGGEAPFDETGLAQLVLPGLDPASSTALLVRHATHPVSAGVAAQLARATAGNPLALLEVVALLTEGQRDGTEPLDDPLLTGPTLERAYLRQLAGLPASTRMALLVAAASETGATAEVMRAIGILGLDLADLERAEARSLVSAGEAEVEFRHPLLRSAVYHGASPGQRRAAHRCLAAVLTGERSADRRAWHRAAAAVAPDEDVAAALERAAETAQCRGSLPAAARALERASTLSPGDDQRARRILGAAEAWQLMGRTEHAGELVGQALDLARDTLLRADVQRQRARIEVRSGRPLAAHRLLLAEAGRIEHLDPARAAMMLIEATLPCIMAAALEPALATAERAWSLGRRVGGEVRLLASLPLISALAACGQAQRARSLLADGEGPLDELDPVTVGQTTGFHVFQALVWLEDHERAGRLLDRTIAKLRAVSALGLLPFPLAVRSELDFRIGHWHAGDANASESLQLAQDTGQGNLSAFSHTCLARLEAARGREAACRAHVARARELADPLGISSILGYASSALGLLELGLGRIEQAIEQLEMMLQLRERSGLGEPSAIQWEPDLIEAYLRAGRPGDAEDALARFERQARTTGRTWALATAARCRALLADSDNAASERAFEEALTWHDQTSMPFERARTELCRGEQLRRSRRRAQARRWLRAALDTFERLGAAPWAERARSELRASGALVRSGKAPVSPQLTPQELQVALMVAKGSTNREAAAALFLSSKTVEAHLGRVYRKLDVRSRTELAVLFAQPHHPS